MAIYGLLARTPQVSDEVIADFINEASQRGFETDELIFVDHDYVSAE
jgi:apolipoprotein D and lipocalin family protein